MTTTLDEHRFARQLDLADPRQLTTPITVVGAGAIGSHVVAALTRMGCSHIDVWDHDTIAVHNLSNQFLPERLPDGRETLGLHKVDVLKTTIQWMTGIEIGAMPYRLPAELELEGLVISGVDSMDARQRIWRTIKNNGRAICHYVDGRMGGQVGQLLHLDPHDDGQVTWYESRLPNDNETMELPCSARSICYTQFVMAGLIASLVRQLLTNESVDIPRETTMDLQHGIITGATSFASALQDHLQRKEDE